MGIRLFFGSRRKLPGAMDPLRRILCLSPVFAIVSEAEAAGDGGGVSAKAYELTSIYGLPITNSMVTSWVFSIGIILVFRWAAGRPKLIPGRGQAVVEGLIEGLREIIGPIVGRRMVKPTFPLLLGFFTFILLHNWSGLLPGVGSFGIREGGHLTYFYRPANTDLNMTLALAIVSFVAWGYFVMRYAGPRVLLHDLFGNKAEKEDTPATMYYLLFLVFFAVGIVEIISILLRLVSLSFRLYGNMFGGENLLFSIIDMAPWWLPIPLPFYLLETLIGLVQALVFTLLVAVYIGLICNHEGEDHAH